MARFLLEDGGQMLLESGGNLLLESHVAIQPERGPSTFRGTGRASSRQRQWRRIVDRAEVQLMPDPSAPQVAIDHGDDIQALLYL